MPRHRFAITMNCTNISPDILSRSLPIQLRYEESDPRHRDFNRENPLQFAKDNRDGILAELLGMVDHWNAQGRPTVAYSHRCHQWASLVGSVLHACGFSEFLTNFDVAAGEFNTQTEELRELFEAVGTAHVADVSAGIASPGTRVRVPKTPLPPAHWGEFLRGIQSHADALGQAKGDSGLGMQARRILGVYQNVEFEFENEFRFGARTNCGTTPERPLPRISAWKQPRSFWAMLPSRQRSSITSPRLAGAMPRRF